MALQPSSRRPPDRLWHVDELNLSPDAKTRLSASRVSQSPVVPGFSVLSSAHRHLRVTTTSPPPRSPADDIAADRHRSRPTSPCQKPGLLLGSPRHHAAVAQLVRAPDCGSGGRWFEPTQLYQKNQWVMLPTGKRGKSRGGMIIRFPRRRESDSLWGCRRPKTSIAFQTPI